MGNIGICFVNTASQIKPDYVRAVAKKCEELGLHSFWVIDRIVYDNLEPLSVLATAAAVTQKLRIGTSVLLAALRHPVLLAKTISTLDFLSAGRITLGVGVGSRENDFTSVGVPFDHRGSRAEETLKLMKRLWTEEGVTHRGRFYKVENVTFGPRPVQTPHPPIWMGGGVEIALKRVARMANGFVCGSAAIETFPSVWEKITGFASAAGRNPEEIEKAALTFMAIADKAKAVETLTAYIQRYYGRVHLDVERQLLAGPPELCAERINSCFRKGINTLIIGQVIPDLRQLDLFGEKVLPQIKS